MVSETTKQPTAFKIGVFTVFIVVMFITMLKSVVDAAPILFVKIGQTEVSAIDITLRARSPQAHVKTGDMNYYALNPFDGMFGWNATQPSDPVPGPNNCGYWPKADS